MNVDELVLATHDLLDEVEVPHAFGGAIALGYYAMPRGTQDVDINVFLPAATAAAVVNHFTALGLQPERPEAEWQPMAGVRLAPVGGLARVDLFLSLDANYDRVAGRARRVPFGHPPRDIPVLAPEDLVVFKLSFGRAKDWVDLQAMADTGTEVDLAEVEDLLIALRGPTLYPRLARAKVIFDAGRSG